MALSMNVVAWNEAIAGSGIVGGLLLEAWGVASFPWILSGLLIIVWSARHHGFKPGPR